MWIYIIIKIYIKIKIAISFLKKKTIYNTHIKLLKNLFKNRKKNTKIYL